MNAREVDHVRNLLIRADVSAPSIQGAAAAMMKMYDKGSTLAVNEWRNALQSCSTSQYLPLLYVCNEVVQTSKRNRGSKFLEAFGPVLGPSLQFICDREPSLTDKVRRTVKIWGDRQVFSLRFVTDLLHRIDTSNKPLVSALAPVPAAVDESSHKKTKTEVTADSFQDVAMNVAAAGGDDDDDDDNEDSSHFHSSGPSLLKVDNLVIDKAAVLEAAEKSKSAAVATFGMKRRRAQEASRFTGSSSNPALGKKHRTSSSAAAAAADPDFLNSTNQTSLAPLPLTRRRSVLSTHNVLELLAHMEQLNREYGHIQTTITSLVGMKLLPANGDEHAEVDDVLEVGDELIQLNLQVNSAIQTMTRHKKVLFSIADQKKIADTEVQKYLPFFKNAITSDDQDIRFCEVLEKKLKLLLVVHADAKKERDTKRLEEAKKKAIIEEAARKAKEEKERVQSLENTMKVLREPKEGQVWNPLTKEYQHVDTNEDWRN